MRHTVRAGDNLWTIARLHAASLSAILRWNVGLAADRLMPGQLIFIPGGTKMKIVQARRPTASPTPPKPRKSTEPKSAAVRPPTTTPRGSGPHSWPLAVRGYVSRGYSAAHPGIDIAAPTGTPVRAVAAGTVIWAGWKNNGGGYVVVIRHPGGMVSYYNHNSRLLVTSGQPVVRGQAIARVGATGWATGPHLDIRLYMAGRFVNPLLYI